MTDRFTESARRVVVAAQEEARNHKNFYVGTEHLLLGLLGDRDDPAARTLEALDIGIDDVRQRVEGSIKPGVQTPSGPIPLTPRAETVLQLAVQEAQLSGQDEVDAVDILLGLIREGTGVAAQVLIDCGAELVIARRAVASVTPWQAGPPGLAAEIAKAVRDHSRDLTEAARNGELGPVIGRRREVGRLVEMLSQYFARNPVLVYGPEADQRTVVAGLAMRIVSGNQVPVALEGKRVLAVDVEQLAQELPAGPPEAVIPATVAEITRLGDIVFCTDSLTVLTAESAGENASPAAILKALLGTDEIKVIGVTTRRQGESPENVAFEKFEPIEIPEPVTLYDIGELKLALENARHFEV
ncbi:MAG TPA: Clp protease N-terminal domain-containing protein [Streptosporangiaceae bacterium]|nr:Clp protease N-terminal domain-containing protein [Streptosporangiaceae bacterium]